MNRVGAPGVALGYAPKTEAHRKDGKGNYQVEKMLNCPCQKWTALGCSEGRDTDEMGQAIELVDCPHYEPFDDAQDKPLTCSHCGHTGQDVELAWQHIGGRCDHRLIPQCINRLACWQRWERNQIENK